MYSMKSPELMKNHDVFLKTDFSNLQGKWVAIVDGKVAGSGDDAKTLLQKVEKENPGKRPLLAKAPTDKILILAAHKK